MPREERKRQYTAIRRQLAKEVNSALACKWNASDDNQRRGHRPDLGLLIGPDYHPLHFPRIPGLSWLSGRFSMLKTWILNGSLDDIEIEEEFTRFAEESQNDMWTTCTLFQLEQMYGTTPEAAEFIAEVTKGTVIAPWLMTVTSPLRGQEGVPHPQAGA